MATCHVCGEHPPDSEMWDHLHRMHPELEVEIERWPDGNPVIVDLTLEPDEFTPPVTENAQVSKMLFEAMCSMSLLLVVTEQGGQRDNHTRQIIRDIAEYRDAKGWSPYGFGGES